MGRFWAETVTWMAVFAVVVAMVNMSQGSCQTGEFECSESSSGDTCISAEFHCDGDDDCDQGEDERYCNTTGADIIINCNTGSFLSKNYPNKYSNYIRQLYAARLSTPGPQQVRVDYVINLEVKASGEMNSLGLPLCNDYVWFPDLSQRLCGTNTTGTTYLSVEGSEFNMTFVTDYNVRKTGFNITYTVLEGDCPNVTISQDVSEDAAIFVPLTDMLTRDSVVFSLRSCAEVTIRLAPHPAGFYDYSRKIRFGVNTNTYKLRMSMCSRTLDHCGTSSDKPTVTLSQPLIDCSQFRQFWVRWTDNMVETGSGRVVGTDVLLTHITTVSVNVRYLYVEGRDDASLDIMFDAPLPYSYCDSSASPPTAQCGTAETTSVTTDSVTTSVTTDIVTTSATTEADSVITSVTTEADSVTTEADSVTTSVTTEADSVTTEADSVTTSVTTEADSVTTEADSVTTSVTTEADSVTTSQPSSQDTTGMTVTNAPPAQISYSREQCACNCVQQTPPPAAMSNLSSEEAKQEEEKREERKQEMVKEIQRNLTVAKQDISSTVRRYVSAGDQRPSSKYVATVIGVVCFLPLAAIIVSDCLTLLFNVGRSVKRYCCVTY